jgi:hypothetical protein
MPAAVVAREQGIKVIETVCVASCDYENLMRRRRRGRYGFHAVRAGLSWHFDSL